MRVLALANQKGGCGKTTAAIHLACALARAGQRVLLADLDPQGHATLGLGRAHARPQRGERDLAHALLGQCALEDIVREAPGGFDLAPGSSALGDFELAAERMIGPERQLGRALRPLEARYDYAVLDCPPRADGVLTANAVRACDRVVLVVETGAFALQGALRAREIFTRLAAELERKPELWVLATLYDRRTRFAREVLVAMQARFGAELFDTAVRTSVRLREAAALGLPVQEFDPKCRAAADFEALARELLGRERDRALDEARSARAPAPLSNERATVPGLGN